eukprot:TRINITY_DN8107_c0_g1_i1.p1 TRINITY_DN8107_c0_g1~~TRINITY_DN8107_c0_g1_i1.p1  ORF type:complete len:624 (+),score=147.19 TRINITY_DN8107_c0_g1_i1:115-1872(+)
MDSSSPSRWLDDRRLIKKESQKQDIHNNNLDDTLSRKLGKTIKKEKDINPFDDMELEIEPGYLSHDDDEDLDEELFLSRKQTQSQRKKGGKKGQDPQQESGMDNSNLDDDEQEVVPGEGVGEGGESGVENFNSDMDEDDEDLDDPNEDEEYFSPARKRKNRRRTSSGSLFKSGSYRGRTAPPEAPVRMTRSQQTLKKHDDDHDLEDDLDDDEDDEDDSFDEDRRHDTNQSWSRTNASFESSGTHSTNSTNNKRKRGDGSAGPKEPARPIKKRFRNIEPQPQTESNRTEPIPVPPKGTSAESDPTKLSAHKCNHKGCAFAVANSVHPSYRLRSQRKHERNIKLHMSHIAQERDSCATCLFLISNGEWMLESLPDPSKFHPPNNNNKNSSHNNDTSTHTNSSSNNSNRGDRKSSKDPFCSSCNGSVDIGAGMVMVQTDELRKLAEQLLQLTKKDDERHKQLLRTKSSMKKIFTQNKALVKEQRKSKTLLSFLRKEFRADHKRSQKLLGLNLNWQQHQIKDQQDLEQVPGEKSVKMESSEPITPSNDASKLSSPPIGSTISCASVSSPTTSENDSALLANSVQGTTAI